MLSYRHAFHAGNHADVLKHIVLVLVLEYMKRKDKAFLYVDTHAGAGRYDLHSSWAQKNREFEDGVGRLWGCENLPEELEPYMAMLRAVNPDGRLRWYPGSPWLARTLLRRHDHALLFELHRAELQALSALFDGDRQVTIEERDGFTALTAALPPIQRRAVVLIDPPYEVKQDYRTVVAATLKACRRFPGGVYLVWYPVVRREDVERLKRDFEDSGIRNILRVELTVATEPAQGMQASGMFIINPPWTLETQLRRVLDFLVGRLAGQGGGSYCLEALVGE